MSLKKHAVNEAHWSCYKELTPLIDKHLKAGVSAEAMVAILSNTAGQLSAFEKQDGNTNDFRDILLANFDGGITQILEGINGSTQ